MNQRRSWFTELYVLSLLGLFLCRGASAALIQATVVQKGEERFLIKTDSTQLKIDRIGGRATKSIAKAIADGRLKWVLYNDQGNRVLVTYIDDQPPLTNEQITDRKQQRRQALEKLGLALLQEFKFLPDTLCTPRGPATLTGEVIAQDKDVIARLAPRTAGQHYEVLPMENYRQIVRVSFRNPEAARAAYLKPFPIYGAHVFAYTCRWDDNNAAGDIRNCTASSAVGVFGTCFLNGIGFSPPGSILKDLTAEDLHALLATGASIGNHSQNHNLTGELRTLPNNEQFREVYLPRVEREAQGDCLIMAVAPPHNKFGDFNTVENWRNAGHYAFAIDAPGARRYPAANVVIIRDDTEPLEFFGAFHASNLNNDLARSAAIAEWKALAKDNRIWQANFNQYAAYRYQYHHTPIAKTVEGATAVFTLYRPRLLDLNEGIPLTFTVAGGAARSITVENGRAESLKADECRFNLHHDPRQFLPAKIGLIANGKPDTKFPGLAAALQLEGDQVRLQMTNASDRQIHDLTVTYRFPNGWSARVLRIQPPAIPSGGELTDSVAVKRPTEAGRTMIGAQLDFRWGDQPSRLHVVGYW